MNEGKDTKEGALERCRKFNIERERFENSIMQLLDDLEDTSNDTQPNRTVLTSIILKF